MIAKQDCNKLVLASTNPHKLGEFRQILSPLGVEVLSAADVGVTLDVDENGATFAENAAIKARALYSLCGLPAVADDSGLCVDALSGRPGIHSARYGGGNLTDSEKIRLLLQELDGVPPQNRTARFVAAIHCVLDDETELACEGVCPGVIGLAISGGNGFGYDPIFYVGERSFAALPAEEKDAISHRGAALRKLAEMLPTQKMTHELTPAQAPALAHLFAYTKDTLIQTFAQGHRGRGWADRFPDPTCGRITVGDFTFLAGDAACPAARELVAAIKPFALAIPQDEAWGALIREIHGVKATRFTRYALKKEPEVFDRAKLEGFVAALPSTYTLRRIDEELYEQCMNIGFALDFCSNYADAADFVTRGLGFCVMAEEELVGGASSYTFYNEGIEIEIAIREDHRRRGLATAVAAKLILTCLDRGLYPSWDAANTNSLALAEKLGYHFDYTYDTYVIREGETT